MAYALDKFRHLRYIEHQYFHHYDVTLQLTSDKAFFSNSDVLYFVLLMFNQCMTQEPLKVEGY